MVTKPPKSQRNSLNWEKQKWCKRVLSTLTHYYLYWVQQSEILPGPFTLTISDCYTCCEFHSTTN